jgi:uncharacterized protein (TIGR03437 family)
LTGIPAGASAVVEVNGLNTRFVEGQVTVGFGSHDVFVRRVWVQSANRVLANVTVQANAAIGASEISVISGFQTVTQPYAFLTQPANPRLPTIALPLNPQPGQTNFFPGSVVTIAGSNLASAGGPTITLTDVSGNTVPAQVASASANLVAFVVPASMPSGVAVLRLNNGVDAALPIAIQIDAQPPVIGAVSTASGLALDASRPISAGELLNLQVLGLDAGVVSAPSRLRVLASGVELPITQILPAGQPGAWLVQVVVTQSFSGQQVPLTISQDGTVSNPYVIVVR